MINASTANEIKCIGNRLRQLREAKGLAVQDVADRTGFGRNTIKAIEEGSNTDLNHFLEITRFLHVHPTEIFAGLPFFIPKIRSMGRTKRRITPKLNQLLYHSSFFDQPRHVGEIVERLQTTFGIKSLTSSEVSVYLQRLVNKQQLQCTLVDARKQYWKQSTSFSSQPANF